MDMYGSRAVTLLVLISDDVINRILKLDIQTNILVYVTRCCTDLTSKVLKERTFGQSSAVLLCSFNMITFGVTDYTNYRHPKIVADRRSGPITRPKETQVKTNNNNNNNSFIA